MPLDIVLNDRIDREATVRPQITYVDIDVVPDAPIVQVVVDDKGMTPLYDT